MAEQHASSGLTVEKIRQARAVLERGDAWADDHGFFERVRGFWREDGQAYTVLHGELIEGQDDDTAS